MASTPIFRLPSELILEILSLLSETELAITSRTCHKLRQYCLDDNLWRTHIQVNVPGLTVTSPEPCVTYRDLFLSMIPFWYLPRGKFWFASKGFAGRLMIIRYSQARQRIEGYVLAAKRENLIMKPWSWDRSVTFRKWDPIFQLEENDTALVLTAEEMNTMTYFSRATDGVDIRMHSGSRGEWKQRIYTQERDQRMRHTVQGPMWPRMGLPAQVPSDHIREYHGRKLLRLEEFSKFTFLSTRWVRQGNDLSDDFEEDSYYSDLYSTRPTEAYTPTAKKPWQGVYCGDYGGHGCEFIVVLQPDNPDPLPDNAWRELMSLAAHQSQPGAWCKMLKECAPLYSPSDPTPLPFDQTSLAETANSDGKLQLKDGTVQMMADKISQKCSLDYNVGKERNGQNTSTKCSANGTSSSSSLIHQGCIKAVKLTGDPNIPHGEVTFIAPDISDIGLLRVADDDDFRGARVVRSVGHIAEEGFENDRYIQSQLILISHDQIAQYWEDFGHISFYHRVDIDALVRTD